VNVTENGEAAPIEISKSTCQVVAQNLPIAYLEGAHFRLAHLLAVPIVDATLTPMWTQIYALSCPLKHWPKLTPSKAHSWTIISRLPTDHLLHAQLMATLMAWANCQPQLPWTHFYDRLFWHLVHMARLESE
jgi:hypothetical protein